MFLFFIFFVSTTFGIHLKIHKNNWIKPQSLNLFSSEIYKESETNPFGSEYDIEMSDEEQMYHKLCKTNNETHYTFQNINDLINYLRHNLLNELKELDLLEEELKSINQI
jgi:phenolic acid decarboxylase